MNRLRPHPHRGDTVAAGAVPLAVAAIVIELRMRQWSLGPRFAVVALIAGLLLLMGWLAELEDEGPRPYHSILLVAGLVPLVLALVLFAEVLGSERPPGAGGLAWAFGLEAAVAVVLARKANSGVCTLIAALSAAVAVEEFAIWVFRPHGLATFRTLLFVLTLAFAAGAVRLRDRRRRHAVQLIDAGGLLALAMAASYVYPLALLELFRIVHPFPTLFGAVALPTAPFGWELYLLAVGFGLIAYAGADRESGPAYIGVAVLLSFALLAGLPGIGGRGSLVGWPLFLLVIGGAGLAVGLRPRKPLPPPPPSGTPAPPVPPVPPVPLHPVGGAE